MPEVLPSIPKSAPASEPLTVTSSHTLTGLSHSPPPLPRSGHSQPFWHTGSITTSTQSPTCGGEAGEETGESMGA